MHQPDTRPLIYICSEGTTVTGYVLIKSYLIKKLREQVRLSLQENNSDFADNFANEEFLSTLAYMADIFGILNEVNTSFQGPNKTIFNMLDKIAVFKLKLDVWILRAGRGELEMFEELHAVCHSKKDKRQRRCHH